jgi:hypothetical protein
MLKRTWRAFFPPCDHEWRDIYGDEILQIGARSICRKCGERMPHLMEKRR